MKTVFIYLLQAVCFSCFSQNSMKWKIGLGTGANVHALKSELVSPYTYKGTGALLQLNVLSGNDKDKHQIQLNYASQRLESASAAISTTEISAYLQYSYHRRIATANGKLKLFAGLVQNTRASRRQNLHDGTTLGNNDAGEIIASIGPSFMMETQLCKGVVNLQCWTALLAWATQPGYALSYPERHDFLSLADFREVNSRIFYQRRISSQFEARIDYQFELFHLSKYDAILSLNHRIVFSLFYNISRL
jgi:hypothetical protein